MKCHLIGKKSKGWFFSLVSLLKKKKKDCFSPLDENRVWHFFPCMVDIRFGTSSSCIWQAQFSWKFSSKVPVLCHSLLLPSAVSMLEMRLKVEIVFDPLWPSTTEKNLDLSEELKYISFWYLSFIPKCTIGSPVQEELLPAPRNEFINSLLVDKVLYSTILIPVSDLEVIVMGRSVT